MITTARLNTRISASADGYSERKAPPINAAKPGQRRAEQEGGEKHAPDVDARGLDHLGIVDAGADQRPSRVRLSSSHSAAKTTMPVTSTNSR